MKWSLLIVTILLFSCKKDKSCEGCKGKDSYVDATILFTGPVATDGCDWVVRVGDTQYYHPETLPPTYLQNDLAVKICYELTGEQFHCGLAGTGMPVIRVIDIRK